MCGKGDYVTQGQTVHKTATEGQREKETNMKENTQTTRQTDRQSNRHKLGKRRGTRARNKHLYDRKTTIYTKIVKHKNNGEVTKVVLPLKSFRQ